MRRPIGQNVKWKRARSSEQVEQRKGSILTACEGLLSESRPHELKMRDVAQESGLAVGAIYRYFRSKEVLILSVYLNKMRDLLQDLSSYSPKEPGLDDFPEHMTKVYAKHKFFWYLSTYTGAILETNLTDDEVREHKNAAMEMTTLCIQHLTQSIPEIGIDEIFNLFMDSFFYTCGLYPSAFPPNNIGKILEEPELENFKPDWETSIRRMIKSLLAGRTL